jgi:hypothetical protein
MTDIKARYVGDSPTGVTLGVRLEDGDIYPLTVPHGGELPTVIDGRKVSIPYRDGLLAQDANWTRVKRDTKPSGTTSAKTDSKDGEK